GQPTEIVEHYFRHEYGRLVSTLVRVFGVHLLETIEDSIQDALQLALTSWSMKGAPENPGAWLYRVAYNDVLDVLRGNKVRARAAERATGELPEYDQPPPRDRGVRRPSGSRSTISGMRGLFILSAVAACAHAAPEGFVYTHHPDGVIVPASKAGAFYPDKQF